MLSSSNDCIKIKCKTPPCGTLRFLWSSCGEKKKSLHEDISGISWNICHSFLAGSSVCATRCCLDTTENEMRKTWWKLGVKKSRILWQQDVVWIAYLKYLFWEPRFLSMASREPMPRYFFNRIPSEKKYSPGASLVAASREPIITAHIRPHTHIYKNVSHKAVSDANLFRIYNKIQLCVEWPWFTIWKLLHTVTLWTNF